MTSEIIANLVEGTIKKFETGISVLAQKELERLCEKHGSMLKGMAYRSVLRLEGEDTLTPTVVVELDARPLFVDDMTLMMSINERSD